MHIDTSKHIQAILILILVRQVKAAALLPEAARIALPNFQWENKLFVTVTSAEVHGWSGTDITVRLRTLLTNIGAAFATKLATRPPKIENYI